MGKPRGTDRSFTKAMCTCERAPSIVKFCSGSSMQIVPDVKRGRHGTGLIISMDEHHEIKGAKQGHPKCQEYTGQHLL